MASVNAESEEPSKVYQRKSFKSVKKDLMMQKESDELGGSDLMKRQKLCDDGGGNFGFLGEGNRVTISLDFKSKMEVKDCRRKLQGELNLVRIWISRIEGIESDAVEVGDLGDLGEGGVKKKKRVHSEVESEPLNKMTVSAVENAKGGIERDGVDVGDLGVDGVKTKCVRSEVKGTPLNKLSVSVLENSEGGIENLGKEKRTPKANQFYRNSEFLLGKDKIPSVDKKSKGTGKKQSGGAKDKIPSEDKKSEGGAKKESGKKQDGGDVGCGLKDVKSQFLKTCKGLLQKLMKHKHGWVFNVPVDVKALGLHDYFDIIKNPMDLGTVKSRLNNNFYRSPMEFMVDVRLTFQNAMTYNSKEQDVHVMAEQLLQFFEEKWAVIEADYDRELQLVTQRERGLERSESMTSADLNTKLVNLGHPGRPAASKKPKARDPNKREMTYEEKQELRENLQSLQSEELMTVVCIMKKRNPSLREHGEEMEVDIDSFDTETLWELDQFFINRKKILLENKRNNELGNKAKPAVERNDHNKNPAPAVDLVEETPKDTKTDKEANQTKNTSEASKSSELGSNSASTSTESGSSSSST